MGCFYSKFGSLMKRLEDEDNGTQDYETRLIGISNSLDILFIEVYAYVLDMLRDYFKLFKKSNGFDELAFEMKKK